MGTDLSFRCCFSVVLLSCLAANLLALDPTLSTNSYLRKDFTIEDGLPDNSVNAIAESHNGFLWVGTGGGLARFDGQHFTLVHLRGAGAREIGVNSLVTTPAGDLWAGTDAGLMQVPKAAVDRFDQGLVKAFHPGTGMSDQVMCLRLSRTGVLWIGTNRGLFRLEQGRLVTVIPDEMISRIELASNGEMLIITSQGFAAWDGSQVVRHPELAAELGVDRNQIFHVLDDHAGARWFFTAAGVARQEHGLIQRLAPYSKLSSHAAYRGYEDPEGNLLVNTGPGFARAVGARLESIVPDLHARAMYSDRDDDLWIGTGDSGLIRFRNPLVRMYTMANGLPSNTVRAVLAGADGTLWVGNSCGGLSHYDGQRFTTYKEKEGLSNSCVWSLAEDQKHDLWVATWGGGLYRFRQGHFTQFSLKEGLPSDVAVSVIAALDGSVWVATGAGLVHMQEENRFRNYTKADGLSSDRITSVFQDHNGGIWAGTSAGIDRLVGDRFVPVPSISGPDETPYNAIREDAKGNLYALSVVNGISRIADNRVIPIRSTLELSGMVASQQPDDFWFSGRQGILKISAAALARAQMDLDAPLDYTAFGRADGLISRECSIGQPNIAITSDRKIWVATLAGLAMLDPGRHSHVPHKPAILVQEVEVGRANLPPGRELVLRPGSYHVAVHFTAVDLASPENIRLQYRLDGVDPVWLDADATRTAIYTDIPVGVHSFHVRASNGEGVWDRNGIVYNITQEPYFYQTSWFWIIVVGLFGLALAGVYLLRVRQITARVQARLEARLQERERIARELHDTLLQGFQGLILRFHGVAKKIPATEPARELMSEALRRADQVMAEGRDRVRDLRSSEHVEGDLARELSAVGEELGQDHPAAFQVVIEGSPAEMHPVVRDEVYQIAREALVNAFCHAQAREIEIELSFNRRELRLSVRDDGRGIDPEILNAGGRPAHWGLRGMRERSRKIGAQFEICSRTGTGTEIELIVPASMAYRSAEHDSRWPWLRWRLRRAPWTP